VVAITLGVVALRRKDRAWLLLGSFAVAVLVGGFWMLFVVGEVVSPH
jgi:hypothetical protein